MSGDRQRLGQRGEDMVARHLARRGWPILRRNYRCRWGEIDLIARDGDSLVFVEVRSRRGSTYGTAAESITPRKVSRLLATARTYLQENGLEDVSWRVDVAALEMTQRGGLVRLDWLENAVEEGLQTTGTGPGERDYTEKD